MKHRKLAVIAAVGGFLLGGATVWYHSSSGVGQRSILLTDAVAIPASRGTGNVRVFMKIANSGPPQHILSVSSRDARAASLEGLEAGTSLILPGNASGSFAADGAHVLLEGVQGDLEEGRLLAIELSLAPAGKLSTKARLSKTSSMQHDMHASANGPSKQDHAARMAGLHMVPDGEPIPELKLKVFEAPDGSGWGVELAPRNFRFAADLVDGEHVAGTGHGHLYLNGLKLGRLFSKSARIGVLPAGRHLVRVTLNTNDHKAYMANGKIVSATASIAVAAEK